MKLIIIIILVYININETFSQKACQPDYNVSTNPDNPINNRPPPSSTKKLNRGILDWRPWDIYIESSDFLLAAQDAIYTPFGPIDWDLTYLLEQDAWEDGWEIVHAVTGMDLTNGNGNYPLVSEAANPWIVMYNRYTSKLRVFTLVGRFQYF